MPGPAHLAKYLLGVLAEIPGNRLFTRDTANELAAVTSGRSPANLVGFYDMDFVTPFGQVQGR